MNKIKITEFSPKYLDLQKSFCCTSGKFDLIKWVGCKPGIYRGAKTLFSAEDLSFCSWFQVVNNYAYTNIDLSSGAEVEIQFNEVEFILLRVSWPNETDEDLTNLEIGLVKQPGLIGSTIPLQIGYPDPVEFDYSIIKDVMLINTKIPFKGPMKINNVSNSNASISILYAY